MTFKKPDDITYTDMCIFIDNNVYTEHFDESKVYEYLYHIIYMLAKRSKLFERHCYYDDFAVYAAGKIYFRLTNPKQNQLDDDGNVRMEKVKSVLNYIKSTLYPMKVNFEQMEYGQTISREVIPEEVNYNFQSLLNKNINSLHLSEFKFLLSDVEKTCKKFLECIPYPKNSPDWINIYVSVMLTFLASITLTEKSKNRLLNLSNRNHLNTQHVFDAYEKESQKGAVLFHLPESMSNYITVLARQLKNIISKDLSYILHTKITSDSLVSSVVVKDFMICEEDYLDEYQNRT